MVHDFYPALLEPVAHGSSTRSPALPHHEFLNVDTSAPVPSGTGEGNSDRNTKIKKVAAARLATRDAETHSLGPEKEGGGGWGSVQGTLDSRDAYIWSSVFQRILYRRVLRPIVE